MAYAEQVLGVGVAITGTPFIRAIASKTGFVRVYDPTLGGTVAASSANLPQVTSIVTRTQFDDAAPWYRQGGGHTDGTLGAIDAGTPVAGQTKVTLSVPAADVVNSASVQTFWVSANALIVTATG